MKKNLIVMTIFSAIFIAGCTTTKVAETNASVQPVSNFGMKIAGAETTIVDWDGRAAGADAIPNWLSPAKRGDYSIYITTFKKKDSDVYRNSIGYGADIRSATMRADMAYARTIARELQQSVNVYAAEQARSGNLSDETRQAIEEVTKTQSNAEITGHQKATEFWQRLITVDPLTNEKSSSYIVYQIYQIPANTWAQTTAKYVRDVIGGIPEELTPEQDFVKGLVGEMLHDARFPTVLSQEEAKQKTEINKKIADAQINLMPAEQKAAADQELAKIMQDGKTERVKAISDAAKVAYSSGNPVYESAPTITAADKDWADAEALVASILF